MDNQDWSERFSAILSERSQVHYHQFFGGNLSGIYSIPESLIGNNSPLKSLFDSDFCSLNIVAEYAPCEKRDTWLYITSGLSNPDQEDFEDTDPDKYCGIGFELVIETNQKELWPIQALHYLMVSQIVIAKDLIEGELLDYGIIYDLKGALISDLSISSFMMVKPNEKCTYPTEFKLSAGKVDFFAVFGVTLTEEKILIDQQINQQSKLPSGGGMLTLILQKGGFPITNINRKKMSLDELKEVN